MTQELKHTPGQSGFTLIEIMITVAIIGIISAIAMVGYTSYILRSHRTDAKATLQHYAALQERYFSQNNSYATDAQLGMPGATASGRYTIGISSDDSYATHYNITATAAGAQASDEDCNSFTVNSLGQTTAKTKGGVAATNCW